MFTKRQLLATALFASGMHRLAEWVARRRRTVLPILAYHRISKGTPSNDYPFDRELISATQEGFRWQMGYLAEHFNPITFQTLIACLNRDADLPKRPVIVTFDDGFEDNATLAYPILREFRIPATIFVATDYVGKTRTFWFDWVAHMVKSAASRGMIIDRTGGRPSLVPAGGSNLDGCEMPILDYLKSIPDSDRATFVEELERLLSKRYPSEGFNESRPLSVEQVKELALGGIEFGSHSASHPILSNVDATQLAAEMLRPRKMIADWIGISPDVVSYPNGDIHSFNGRVIQAARQAGYQIGVSYLPGVNSWPISSDALYCLRRLHVELDVGNAEFACMLAFPSVFSTIGVGSSEGGGEATSVSA